MNHQVTEGQGVSGEAEDGRVRGIRNEGEMKEGPLTWENTSIETVEGTEGTHAEVDGPGAHARRAAVGNLTNDARSDQ